MKAFIFPIVAARADTQQLEVDAFGNVIISPHGDVNSRSSTSNTVHEHKPSSRKTGAPRAERKLLNVPGMVQTRDTTYNAYKDIPKTDCNTGKGSCNVFWDPTNDYCMEKCYNTAQDCGNSISHNSDGSCKYTAAPCTGNTICLNGGQGMDPPSSQNAPACNTASPGSPPATPTSVQQVCDGTDALDGLVPTKQNTTNTTEKKKSSCFPGLAVVQTPNASVPLRQLNIGDQIRTASGFEPVLGWMHASKNASGTDFLQITHSGGVVTMTPDHLLYVANGSRIAARDLQVGDQLPAAGNGTAIVKDISIVSSDSGLYSPWTASSTVVVDGVLCSTFVDLEGYEFLNNNPIVDLVMAVLSFFAGFWNALPAAVDKQVSTDRIAVLSSL